MLTFKKLVVIIKPWEIINKNMFKITKEKIEDFRNNKISCLADEWLQDVIDFDKIDKLQEFINFNNISNFKELENVLSNHRNQEEIAEQLDINY